MDGATWRVWRDGVCHGDSIDLPWLRCFDCLFWASELIGPESRCFGDALSSYTGEIHDAADTLGSFVIQRMRGRSEEAPTVQKRFGLVKGLVEAAIG